MVISRVPRTNIRLKHLIQVFSSPDTKPFDLERTDFTALISSMTSPIGGIQSMGITSERELYQWRELNHETLGRIMEVYPSLGTFTLSVAKIAFYQAHLLDAFKATPADALANTAADQLSAGLNVYNQISPLHIMVDILTPYVDPTTGQHDFTKDASNIKVLFYDCWFDKSEIEFDVTDDDLALIQDAELTCAGIYTGK